MTILIIVTPAVGGVWSVNGISPTLRSFSGGGNYPMIVREVIKRKATNENQDE